MPYNFLFASWSNLGDLGPMLTGARQLRDRGHNVRFIAGQPAREHVLAAGFAFTPWQRKPNYAPVAQGSDPRRQNGQALIFGPAASHAADTRDAIRSEPTDALVAFHVLFGSAMAAEAEGLPYVLLSPSLSARPLSGVPPLHSGLRAPRTIEERAKVDAAGNQYAAFLNEWLPMINEARASQGLEPLSHVLDAYNHAPRVLLAVSSAFDFPADYLPANTRYIGPLLDDSPWTQPWDSRWSVGPEHPRALVFLGTTDQNQAAVLQRIINAVGDIEMEAVVTVGPIFDPARFQAPQNVIVLSSVPHDAVMTEVSLAVVHGGHGSVNRALLHDLPLLVMPLGRDQSDNAVRVEDRGAGLTLPPSASETEIATALKRLIHECSFREAARTLAQAIANEIKAQRFVTEVEEVVNFR